MKKKICVITGSRADYGLLRPLIKKLETSLFFDLQIVVTGSHTSEKHGNTISEIEEDKLFINDIIKTSSISDSPVAISKSLAKGIDKFSVSLDKLKPDLIFVLGDRYEIFAACITAFLLGIPIAHHSGGEVTEGAFDDSIRHSITKMANIHFVSAPEYKKRVVQLGENPKNVYVVGGFGVENINNINLLSKSDLEQKLNFTFNQKTLILTFHSETLDLKNTTQNFYELLAALDLNKDIAIIFTLPNADTFNLKIIKMINNYIKQRKNVVAFKSMGTNNYLSSLQYVDGVIGNSSSGICEVPSFKKGSINIGIRQKGRLKASSIIDCIPNRYKINEAIKKLYSTTFQKKLKNTVNPYDNGETSDLVIKILESSYDKLNVKKAFFDINFNINKYL
jgi:GDP/UDP-N,N'-diacetylbacillosamine 2-epimerase (hydrolysing)